MFFDPLYFLVVGPTMLLSMWASFKVRSAFNQWKQYANKGGYSGAHIARAILDASGLKNVRVEHVAGELTDHYDPTSKTLRLSDATYSSNSIAAAGVAAHEAGHAIQDKVNYPMLGLRSAIVPLASISSNLSWILIMGGMFLMVLQGKIGYIVTLIGVLLFSVVVVFQLVTVPVEIDASRRAKQILKKMGYVEGKEAAAIDEVLDAAAWTYVAAAASGIATLLYYLLRLGFFRSDD
ncbi:MAG: zinc metallopeptidase [Leptospiraceae bacterium]|nr:zinc metallopeptidase [Leptospiraceae bacterium]MCP5496393.1 zinc metallopeptidase [Leptospiraceae bacterium]